MIWVVIALVCVAAAAALAWPLAHRRSAETPPRAEFDLAVYRDQLAEIDRDRARGLLTETERDAARLEVERRMLAAVDTPDSQAQTARQSPAAKPRRALVAAVATAVPALGVAVYLAVGTPSLGSRPGAENVAAAERAEIARYVERLAQHVQENPADARGWSMLGRSYTLLGRFGEASEAYAKAETLAPRDADLLSRHAEARIMANNGTVGEDARGLIARALAIDPKDPRARFYQAVGEIQAGREHEALNLLVALEADTPADAAWRPVVTRRIDALASQLGLDPAHLPGRAAPSPATAAPLAPERAPPPGTSGPDQAKMIRGMVEGLAARLEKEPNDPDGWARLGKSYGVLGEREKSRDAWRHAAELKPDDPAILAAYASAMLTAAGDGPAPPEFAATAAQLLRVAPDNPDALWFAGVAAQARGDASAARKYWQSLLDRLPAESPARDEVARALAELK